MPEPLIVAHQLVKRFGDFTAVDSIDVEVQPGEVFGFLGPNGAGKSSTMRMIACVSPVTSGTMRLFGLDPATNGPEIRGRIGVVPQLDTLDGELSVQENLWLYGRYFDLPRAEAKRLFSTTFFPISSYGSWAWVVQFSPLYHGVALVRAANAGVWTTSVLGHIAVLVALSAIALVIAARRIDLLLRK